MGSPYRIGTRDSELALWQAKNLQKQLGEKDIDAVLVPIKSEGDLNLSKPLYEMGIVGVFTKSLDIALLNGKIDLAIHSMKDVPTQLPKGIVQAAVLGRGKTKDVVVWKSKDSAQKKQRTVATGSLRRKAQWQSRFPNDRVEPLRGNIQTRLKKLHQTPHWDGAIFAEVALKRLAITDENISRLDTFLPAPAQGALLVVCREEDHETRAKLAELNDEESALCTHIERSFLKTLEGGCTAPIAALAHIENKHLHFEGALYSLQGKKPVRVEKTVPLEATEDLGIRCAEEILSQGGKELMQEFKSNGG